MVLEVLVVVQDSLAWMVPEVQSLGNQVFEGVDLGNQVQKAPGVLVLDSL